MRESSVDWEAALELSLGGLGARVVALLADATRMC